MKSSKNKSTPPVSGSESVSHIKNSNLFSNQWLESRLKLEPEWEQLRGQATDAINRLHELWKTERSRVNKYHDEAPLEQKFIQPVFDILGWKLIYQTYLRKRKPDYALFTTDDSLEASLNEGKKSPKFWLHTTIVADAKAWSVNLDRPTRVDNKREYPPEQIEWYINNSGVDYGILTNGRLWRLFPRQLELYQPRFKTYYQCDLESLLNAWDAANQEMFPYQSPVFDDFLMFYLLFSPQAFVQLPQRLPLIERARTGSTEYRIGVQQDIKERVFGALRLCIAGFLDYDNNELSPTEPLEEIEAKSFVLLFRLLFVMYAEDRQLLPYKINHTYTKNRSLGSVRDEVASRLDTVSEQPKLDYSKSETGIWEELGSLFDLIDNGHKLYDVPPLNGGLFSSERNRFLIEKKISDWYMARIVDALSRAIDSRGGFDEPYRVDYRDLQIQNLGTIYEALLELHPIVATKDVAVVRKKTPKTATQPAEIFVAVGDGVPRGYEDTNIRYSVGDVYLATDKGERRATGSYYTPEHIVDYIVRMTLGPMCDEIDEKLRSEIQELEKEAEGQSSAAAERIVDRIQDLKTRYDDRVLELKILDPSMGSGHFLLRACQYLAERIASHEYTADDDIDESATEEAAIVFWKRRVVERCLYGVDLNPVAVDLAKLALWLETVSEKLPLAFLQHHLRTGNSLIGVEASDLRSLPVSDEGWSDKVQTSLDAMLPEIVDSTRTLIVRPSTSVDVIHEKEQEYERVFEKELGRFKLLGDVWCSAFFTDDWLSSSQQHYIELCDKSSKPRSFDKLKAASWVDAALSSADSSSLPFYHWDFEHPEVMLSGVVENDCGFDAVIGNPPYDVLSEKELGFSIKPLKEYVKYRAHYAPSMRGKNNLYKLFLCKALVLARSGGRLGFITPMALLGDDQAADLRRELFRVGRFTSIDAFPQKDNPQKRVFPEAKLSTVVFTYLKGDEEDRSEQPFKVRVHPEGEVVLESPSMVTSATDLLSYDSENVSIVACDQQDWDLAVRIIKSGRLRRLSEYAEQYQGEVNETTSSKKGHVSSFEGDGPLILRGANISLYAVRSASQGKPKYIRKNRFLEESRGGKAGHSQQRRVGFQRSSPQQNFRRIIAAYIDADNYCFDTVSYVTEKSTTLPLRFVLGLLNSKLLDWYFRLGSTNSKVNEYQFKNLPCPEFSRRSQDKRTEAEIGRIADSVCDIGPRESIGDLRKDLGVAPFPIYFQDVVVELVRRIEYYERMRGDIGKRERSRLCEESQPYQDAVDQILFRMAGLEAVEIKALENRLAKMI